MATRLKKGKVVKSCHGSEYTIEEMFPTPGQFALSYRAKSKNGREVFLKQYKSPSKLTKWYRDYISYQDELKRRVDNDKRIAERCYEFVEFFEDAEGKCFYQAFEFIKEGEDLKAYLAENKMSVHERYVFASLFLYTLTLFHAAGIVHTDLKPANVYLVKSNTAKVGYNLKLIDFDFSILSGRKAPWHDDPDRGYCGSPRYMSPEHLRKGDVPNDRSDVFTAALMCYELLTKNGHPYPEEEEKYNEAAQSGRPPVPDFLVPETPAIKNFGRLLMRSLAAKSSDRPSMQELHQALVKARADFLSEPKKPSGKPTTPAPPPSRPSPAPSPRSASRLGLSFGDEGATDWFKMATDIGKHSSVSALQPVLKYLSSVQFRLVPGGGSVWYAEPPGTAPQNLTTVNGTELTARTELKAGDVIGIGSRKIASKRVLYKMTVSIAENP